jgi:mannose-6-phosphate isomerase-like protein (cupin superfamily)
MNPNFLNNEIVIKQWGYENIITNNDKYCLKILHFEKGYKFSMHFHDIKDETWYLQKGKMIFYYIETNTAILKEKYIKEGDIIHIPRLLPHQLLAIEESDIIEVSTKHYDSDSYRIMKGDNQLDK